MILLKEETPDCIVLKAIMGKESKMQLEINGFTDMDITDFIKSIGHKRVILKVSKCKNENVIINHMNQSMLNKHIQDSVGQFMKESIKDYDQPKTSKKKPVMKCLKCRGRINNKNSVNGICKECIALDEEINKIQESKNPDSQILKDALDIINKENHKKDNDNQG
jgi:hypothetical protein